MKYSECFSFLASRRNGELVITSAGHSGMAWWQATHDTEATFYLAASMSLSTMFASGLAYSLPDSRIWAFMGDGAFCMNPGTLMVERQMNLPNLTHFLVSNRRYGATSNALLPNLEFNDYETIAMGMGLKRVFSFDSINALEYGFDKAVNANVQGHTFVVLELEPVTSDERKPSAPFDGPELKYRFGRYVERTTGVNVFSYSL